MDSDLINDEKEAREPSTCLSTTQLKSFCSANNLKYEEVSLQNLEHRLDSLGLNCFVHTGEQKDDYNNGYINHWMLIHGDGIFDSYGYQNHYKLPSNLKFFHTVPKRIQEYDSDVCGQYCCQFYSYCHANPTKTDPGIAYSHYYGYTTDRKKNDGEVLEWFKNNKNKKE
jgi:hypothetical protein